MPLFVVYSYVHHNDPIPHFGNHILEDPAVQSISTNNDLFQLEIQIRSFFGIPEMYQDVVIHDWKWLPENKPLNVSIAEEFQKAVDAKKAVKDVVTVRP